MSSSTIQKPLTKGVLDSMFFVPTLTEQTTTDDVDYGILLDTPLSNTIIEHMYLGVKDKDNGFTFEVNDIVYTCLSADEIVKRSVFNNKMHDFMVRQLGMGWAYMFYYIPETGMVACREDGGFSNYDREYNYNKYSSDDFKPSDFEMFEGDLETNTVQFGIQYQLEHLLTILKNS
jgi:hypothetical protein